MVKTKKSSTQTVTGIIIPEKWDEKGNVTVVSIQMFDESEYIVRGHKLWAELLRAINQTVKITGKVAERLDGRLVIEAKSLEVIKDREVIGDGDSGKGQQLSSYS
jgi:hypothetical protein